MPIFVDYFLHDCAVFEVTFIFRFLTNEVAVMTKYTLSKANEAYLILSLSKLLFLKRCCKCKKEFN